MNKVGDLKVGKDKSGRDFWVDNGKRLYPLPYNYKIKNKLKKKTVKLKRNKRGKINIRQQRKRINFGQYTGYNAKYCCSKCGRSFSNSQAKDNKFICPFDKGVIH